MGQHRSGSRNRHGAIQLRIVTPIDPQTKDIMKRILVTSALVFSGLLVVTGCATGTPAPDSPEAPAGAEVQESSEAEAEDSKTVMPQGARPGSADFPFPVPQDWPELSPFVEEKIGKKMGRHAVFGHPGDAASAAATYRSLLEEAGFAIHPNPLGEQVHAASFVAKGDVDGVDVAGTLDFDTDAAGTHRVVINLTES